MGQTLILAAQLFISVAQGLSPVTEGLRFVARANSCNARIIFCGAIINSCSARIHFHGHETEASANLNGGVVVFENQVNRLYEQDGKSRITASSTNIVLAAFLPGARFEHSTAKGL